MEDGWEEGDSEGVKVEGFLGCRRHDNDFLWV